MKIQAKVSVECCVLVELSKRNGKGKKKGKKTIGNK